MNADHFADATLVVLGHGTTQNDGSAAPVFQHAAELRRRRIFGDVREAFWKQDPQVKPVLLEIKTPRAFIVPLFISEGYFAAEVIPRELGFSENRILNTEHARLFYCAAIGTHDLMTGVILARAREVVEKFPFPRAPKPADITLVIAGHGTERNANSRDSIERQVELIRAQNVYAAVHAVFLDEEPRIPACFALAPTRNLVVVPFFISDGLHTQEDIPILLGEPERIVKQRLAAGQPTWRNPTERNDKLVWYSPAVGTAPEVAEVILERVRESSRSRGDETQT
ncbi:MAG: cobalamin biosynthesis protein CbiX [Pedosphaera sp.]|nr:cobalamin biosynthesis protein CbiX [Pedosphaera sp.]